MSWLRLDDGFATHPKILELTDRELRAWIGVLCHCAQQHDPSVDRVTIQVVSGLTLRRLSRLIEVGLLDVSGGDYEVHDWEKYQPKDPTGALRQAKWRAKRNAERNGESNGLRNALDRYENVTSRARGPVPSRPSTKDETFGVDVEHQQPIDEREPEPREDPPGDLHELVAQTATNIGSTFGKGK